MSEQLLYDEKKLIALVADSDENAFRVIFDQYRDMVHGMAFHLLKNTISAEDVLQEVFLKIWKNNSRLPEIENFKAYLLTVTRNQVYTRFRSMAREALLLETLEKREQLAEDPRILDTLSAKELEDALQVAMSMLTGQQKKVFELSRIQGLKHAEIAAQLGLNRETVKKHMTDALRTIRTSMKHYHPFIQAGILLYLYSA